MTNNKDCTKYLSERQEQYIARAVDGRRTPMSGAGKFILGDVLTARYLIEAKTQMQEKKTFTIKREWLDKAREEAFATHKDSYALAFNFGGEAEQQNNYYVITEEDFKRLVNID